MSKDDAGPDRVKETDCMRTWERDGAVKIKHEAGGKRFGPLKPTSLVTWMKRNCEKGGNHSAYGIKKDGKWVMTTYNEYHKQIRTVAKAFIKLGLEPFHSVAISGFNAPEWTLSCLSAMSAGGFSCGLYPTNSPEMNKFIMNDSESNILVVEDDAAAKKFLSVRDDIPSLKKIVQYVGKPSDPDVLSWSELMEIGAAESDSALEERHANMYTNQCVCLIYTSGTTGNPKGVMLSHDNILFTVESVLTHLPWNREHVISYLPLSHIAALMIDVFGAVSSQSTVYYADKGALKGTLLNTLQEVRPTQFFGVPRVWEKIEEGMLAKGATVKGAKKKLSTAVKAAALDYHLGQRDSMMFQIGKKAFFPKIKQALGLDRCEGFFSAAAPISMETLQYFLSLDIAIKQIFGMSETCGPHTMNLDPTGAVAGGKRGQRLLSVGPSMIGTRTKLYEAQEDGDGELCCWGRNIMMGYLNREDKTNDDLDEEGWLHTGDLASIDGDGYVYITGRIKELLITAGGENIAPVPIEDRIKKEVPLISNVVLIGDRKKYLSAFLTLKTVLNTKTEEPTRELLPTAIEWCKSIGRSNMETVDDILKGPDPVVMAAVQAGIDRANKDAVSNASRVQKWTILPLDLSVIGGELGPTLKLKRFAINKKFANAVENLYV